LGRLRAQHRPPTPSLPPCPRRIVDQVEPLREVGAGEREEDGTLAGFETVQLLSHAELVDDAVELLAQRRIAALTELGLALAAIAARLRLEPAAGS
jgi:hypothetical protein